MKIKNQNNAELDPDLQELIETVLHDALKVINGTAYSIITDMEARGKKMFQKTAREFQKIGTSLISAISGTDLSILNKSGHHGQHWFKLSYFNLAGYGMTTFPPDR